jgi:hypothetical protein
MVDRITLNKRLAKKAGGPGTLEERDYYLSKLLGK